MTGQKRTLAEMESQLSNTDLESAREATLSFNEDGARIRVARPEAATQLQRQISFHAFTKCWKHLEAHPTTEFILQLLGSPSQPEYEVFISQRLLCQLPLLHDISCSTDQSADTCANASSATAMKLFSVFWGFISLLVLIEGQVTVEEWFGDPSAFNETLPAQTLEAACYMGCCTKLPVKVALIKWLRGLFAKVVESPPSPDTTKDQDFTVLQECTNQWYWIKVLRSVVECVPQEVCTKLMLGASKLSKGATPAMLPADLIPYWLALYSPVLDMRRRRYQADHISKLLVCLPLVQGPAVHTLDLTLDNEALIAVQWQGTHGFFKMKSKLGVCPEGHDNRARSEIPTHICYGYTCSKSGCRDRQLRGVESVLPLTKLTACAELGLHIERLAPRIPCATARCATCGATTEKKVHVGCLCSSCSSLVPACQYAPQSLRLNGFQQQLQDSTTKMLRSIFGCAAHLTSLQHLGLHSMYLTLPAVRILGNILSSLPLTTTELTLSGLLGEMKHADTVFLFKAIALLRGLKKLHMPEWENMVGIHARECVQALKSMPCLEVVYVAEVKQSDVFPPGITFKAI